MAERRVAVVTGATGAIGRAIAAGLSAEPGLEVVLVARDAAKLSRVASSIAREHPLAHLRQEVVDVSRLSEIAAFSSRMAEPVHVLVNNAAVAPPRRLETPEGIELVFATNVLGYLWMVEALEAALGRAAQGSGARVVNVASYWAGDLDLADLELRERRYDNDVAYRQSKQANRMLTVAQAGRLAPLGITVNACHPGDVRSKLSGDLGFGGSETPEQGARTPLWLALSPEVSATSGRWFEGCTERSCRFASDRTAIARLSERCASYRR